MTHHPPRIGINTQLEITGTRLMTGVRPPAWQAILGAGGLPMLMPQLQEAALIDAFLDQVDGFLMVGGDDLPENRAGRPLPAVCTPIHPLRDRTDFLLLERLLTRRIPTLAMCLGMQEINVIHGGSLYLDLPSDGPHGLIPHIRPDGDRLVTHAIALAPESRPERIWAGSPPETVNSSHHQAVRDLGRGLRRVAWAPDGITEAIEVEGQPFFLGVQWHPEYLQNQPEHQKLFAALVSQAVQ